MKYILGDDLQRWEKYSTMTQKELVKRLVKLLPNDFSDFLPNSVIIEALKMSVGLKYKIPDTFTLKQLEDMGYENTRKYPIVEHLDIRH